MLHSRELISSGNPLVDLTWGGFYRGGTYFLSGRRKSGKTLSALQFVKKTAEENESCLIFTSSRPRDLIINASAIDIDLQNYVTRNIVTLVRVTPPKDLGVSDDSYYKEYLHDIKKVVDQYKPARIVFDEITPFIGFKDLNLLKETFLELTDYIEERSITSLYLLSEPATPLAKKAVNVLMELSTGYIALEKEEGYIKNSNPGLMKIKPNVGHLEGEFRSAYYIKPLKGLEVDYYSKEISDNSEYFKEDYKPLSEFESLQGQYPSTSVYSVDEFKLLLNNQIAYYQSTGEIFTLISIKLGEVVQKNNLLTINQLANSVRLSIEKKDKLCIIGSKVLVLFPKEDKNVKLLVSMILTNLPDTKPDYVDNISPFVFLFSVRMDETIKNSDELFERLDAINKPDRNNIVLI